MSGYGYTPKPITLLDQKLTLDPEVAATIAEIEAQIAARKWLEQLQNPDWTPQLAFFQTMVSTAPRPVPKPAIVQINLPPLRPVGPLTPPGFPMPGRLPPPPRLSMPEPLDLPEVPKPGEISDVVKAVVKLPFVQQQFSTLLDMLGKDFDAWKLDLAKSGTAGKVFKIALPLSLTASMIAGLMVPERPREAVLDFLVGKTIPIPIKIPVASGGQFSLKFPDDPSSQKPASPPVGMFANQGQNQPAKQPPVRGLILQFEFKF